jgi:hypothetical protein
MSSFTDEELIGRLFVGDGKPEVLGRGEKIIRGATYMQGPTQVGQDRNFSEVEATLMVGPLRNIDCETPSLSLRVKGNAVIDKLNVQSWKGFDIQHPTKENHRLRYVCLEGPEGGVYIRGRVKNKTEIQLPDYWKDLVDIQSLTVSLTPIGAHQDVIVKRWDEKKIYLQAKGGMPIDCFYHIFAERKDGEKLIVEYQGETPADYPGDSSQYSIAGYDYGRKE